MSISSAGAVTFPAINFTSSPAGNLNSGTYTPTLTASTNVADITLLKAFYTRVGNVVTVNVTGTVDPTDSGQTLFYISLPIASNLSAASDLCGTGVKYDNTAVTPIYIEADSANDRAAAYLFPANLADTSFKITFSYVVL
jgi:hypothetical protein